MSIIFGICSGDNRLVERSDLTTLSQATQNHANDGTYVYNHGIVGMGFQPYNTHRRSTIESLPLTDRHGNILSFDGRLDNYSELGESLGLRNQTVSDSYIILRAFEQWGQDCFSRLVGDWALSLWSKSERALYLARDHAGTRSLYFEHFHNRVIWSTFLDTFFADGRTAELEERFATQYLSCQPIRELTPFKGIRAVPPSHYVRFEGNGLVLKSHWNPRSKGSIHYARDDEYDEHFLELFGRAVERRTGTGEPVLAELSGGMDSTSIVCMSDHIRLSRNPDSELLDTISFYDDSEPNWNEFPFFTAVEKSRRKIGLHISLSYSNRTIRPADATESPLLWPGGVSPASDPYSVVQQAVAERGVRCIISGLGGDEVLGGVPTPYPELADLMVSGHWFALSQRTLQWCLANREPFFHMIWETLKFTKGLYGAENMTPSVTPPWLNSRLQKRIVRSSLPESSDHHRFQLRLPSRLANGDTWSSILETLPNRFVSSGERFEYRYPYLDRDLVEFLFRIPRNQLIEPGRRRALMRRALKNIVPNEVLERRRKAYVISGPIKLIQREHSWLCERFRTLHCAEMGLVDSSTFLAALDSVAVKEEAKWRAYLMRLISFEFWLDTAPVRIPSPTAVTATIPAPSHAV